MDLRRRSQVARMFIPQIGLRWFITGTLLAGAAAGLGARWWLSYPTYQRKEARVDGFRVSTIWVNRIGHCELLCLLASPDGDGGRADLQPVWAKRVGRRELMYLLTSPDTNGGRATRKSNGFASSADKLSQSAPGWPYWVNVNVADGEPARPVPVDPDCQRLTPEQFAMLGQTRLWIEFLRPALIEESRRFDRSWVDRYGVAFPHSRFTSKEAFDGWIAERQAKVKIKN